VNYSYAKGRQFHGRAEPDRITIYQGGTQVLSAEMEIVDLGDTSPNAPAAERYPAVTLGMFQRHVVMLKAGPGQAANRRAIVHATFDMGGRMIEAEMTAADDPSIAQTAMELLVKGTFRGGNAKQGGLLQSEVYVDVRTVE
jgi:hypothetical protein